MLDIAVIGHKVPDTDCVLSAIIASNYLEKKGYSPTVYMQGGLNKETEFLLQQLNIEKPEIKTSFEPGTRMCLVDHNEDFQAPDNISELDIAWVIDHHKMNFKTATPLYMRVEPICSTGSILYKMYKEAGFEISQEIATMMLACILSDSLLFRSATTTKEDTILAEELQKITGISDVEAFAMPMFHAKSDLGDMEIEKVIKYDYKEFDFNGTKAGIGTLETTNPGYALGRKEEILSGMQKIKELDKLDFIILSVVDIIGEKNTTITLDGPETKIIEEVFQAKVDDNLADLKNRLSRKKQVVPDLTKYFEKK
ncbi:MAG: manganese-dependent inorganic pyrophosphatase [Candidatus Gracilibacteria bacterium]|nr:manganese-dependent inorganic pyrophosphatase [Candidatus Gracilibacteria bacterium]